MSKKLSNSFIGIAALTAMWSANSPYLAKQRQIYGSAIYIPKRHKKKNWRKK